MRRTRNPVYGNPVSRVQIPPFPPSAITRAPIRRSVPFLFAWGPLKTPEAHEEKTKRRRRADTEEHAPAAPSLPLPRKTWIRKSRRKKSAIEKCLSGEEPGFHQRAMVLSGESNGHSGFLCSPAMSAGPVRTGRYAHPCFCHVCRKAPSPAFSLEP